MNRINESTLNETRLIGTSCCTTEKKIKNLIDSIENNSNNIEMFNFFDIKGTVLLYGIAKTVEKSSDKEKLNSFCN